MKEQVYNFDKLTLVVKDSQRTGKFKLGRKKELFTAYLQQLQKFLHSKHVVLKQYSGIEVSLHFCGKRAIRTYNRTYRNIDKVTDVLSFPLFDNLRKDCEFLPPYLELGDIFICREVAIRQAKEYDLTLEQEVMRQLIHGSLHLLGFDHEVSEQEEKLMFKHEEKIYRMLFR